MKVTRLTPKPPPPTFTMSFSQDEGWVFVAALNWYADKHPEAVHKDLWREWAADLDRQLRL